MIGSYSVIRISEVHNKDYRIGKFSYGAIFVYFK